MISTFYGACVWYSFFFFSNLMQVLSASEGQRVVSFIGVFQTSKSCVPCSSLEADNAHTCTTLAWQMVGDQCVCVCVSVEQQGLRKGFSSCGVQTMPMKTESVLEPGSCLKIQTETQYGGWLKHESFTGSLTEMPSQTPSNSLCASLPRDQWNLLFFIRVFLSFSVWLNHLWLHDLFFWVVWV